MAGSIKGITIELNGDTKGLDSALKEVTTRSVNLGKELKTVEQRLKLDPGNADLVAQKQQLLSQAIETTSQKLDVLRAAQAQVKAQFDSGTITHEQYIAFQQELTRTEQRMHSLTESEAKFQAEQAATDSSTKTLTQTVSEQEKELAELKAKYVDVAAAQGADSDEAKQLAGEIQSLSGELKDNKGKLSEAENAANQLDQTVDELSDSEKEAEQSTSKLGNALKTGLTVGAKVAGAALKASLAAIGAASTAALKFAKDSVSVGMTFDASVSQIGATLGYTVDQLKGDLNSMSAEEAAAAQRARDSMEMLRDKAQEMGAQTSFSASEAAEGLNILAMSGYDAESSCAMIGDVLNLAAAGSLSLADAAAYTSGAVKGFADDTKDAQYYTDLMAKGATLANTDVKALGEALSGGAATAASYGQSAEGLTLALLRMAEQGVTGTQATTSLNRAMADLYTPSDAAAKKLEELGVSAYDADHNARDFNDVVDDLNAALSDMTPEAQNAAKSVIFTSNGLQAFNKMTVTSTDKVNEWSDALANAAGSAGAQAETMLDNLQGDVTKFGSAMEGARIVLSDALTPTLREFVQFGTDSVSQLTAAFKDGGLTGAISALGPILEGLIQKISEMLPAVISVASELVTALASQLPTLLQAILPPLISGLTQVLTALVGQLPALFSIISSSMPLLIDAILTILPKLIDTGLQIIVQLAQGIAQSLPTLIPTIVEVVLQIVDTLIDNIDMLIDASIQLILGLADGLIQALPILIDKAPTIIQKLVSALVDNASLLIDASIELIAALAGGILSNLPQLIAASVQIVGAIVKGLLQAQGKVLNAARSLLGSIGNTVKGFFSQSVSWGKGLIEKMGSGISSARKSISGKMEQVGAALYDANAKMQQKTAQTWDAIKNSISNALTATKNIITNVWNAIKSVISAVQNAISSDTMSIWQKIQSVVTAVVNAVKSVVTSVWNAIKAAISSVLSAISSNVSSVWNSIKSAVSNAMNTISSTVSGIWNNIKSATSAAIGGIKSTIQSGFDNAVNYIKGLASQAWSWGSDIISGIINGIKSKIGELGNAVTGVANTIKSYLHFSVPDVGPLTDFPTWMPDMMQGLAQGITQNMKYVKGAVSNLAAAMIPSVDLSQTLRQYDAGLLRMPPSASALPTQSGTAEQAAAGNSVYNITVNVQQMSNDYDARRAAEIMAQEIERLKTDNNSLKGAWSV